MSFEEMLKKLKTEYITNLPSKAEELQFLVDNKDFEELENFFHKLKGSGKSYGVSEVTTYGEYFENLLKSNKALTDAQMTGALTLLEKIVESRQQDSEFDILSSEEFQTLKAA